MPVFEFDITIPATQTARVRVEAETIEAAQEQALAPSFYRDPSKAEFKLDEENLPRDAYLPDEGDYEEVSTPTP